MTFAILSGIITDMPGEAFPEFDGPTFVHPIDLSDGKSYTVPYLSRTALLDVGGDFLAIVPVITPEVQGNPTYELVSLGAVERQLRERGIQTDEEEILQQLANPYDMPITEKIGSLTGTIIINSSRGRITVGQDTTPELELSPAVSRQHAEISVNQEGLTIHDVGSNKGTKLYLDDDEIARDYEVISDQESIVSDEERDELLNTFAREIPLGDRNIFEYESEDLHLFGALDRKADGSPDAVEFRIFRANKYDNLNPRDDEEYVCVSIAKDEDGVAISFYPKTGEVVANEGSHVLKEHPDFLQCNPEELQQIKILASELNYHFTER